MKTLTTAASDRELTVFNPLGWTRDAPVSLPAPRGVGDGCWTLRDEEGSAIAAVCSERRLRFTAPRLPAFGMRRFRIAEPSRRPAVRLTHRPNDYPHPRGWTFETSGYSIVIDPRSGLIKRLRDTTCGRDVVASVDPWWDESVWSAETGGDGFSVHWETPHAMSAWLQAPVYRVDTLLAPRQVRRIAEADRTVISIRQTYRRSRLQHRILLYPDRPYIDFELDVDWRAKGGPRDGVPVLRAGFYMAMKNPRAFFDVPFGVVERPTARHEYPALKWAALREGDYWVALLNREKHGYNLDGNNLALTLLRNAYDPDPESDTGRHTISYRLLFGRLDPLAIARLSAEYELSPVARRGCRPAREAGAPCEVSGGVLVTGLKAAMDGDGVALRLLEVNGERREAVVRFRRRPRAVLRSNVLEAKGRRLTVRRDGSVKVSVNPHAIVTLLARF